MIIKKKSKGETGYVKSGRGGWNVLKSYVGY